MNSNPIDTLLQNYKLLLERVDTHIQQIEKQFPDQIACKKGCDSCCRFLSLFPVEAFSISDAYSKLPRDIKQKIAKQLKHHKNDCPLLVDNACALYSVRPIICRTHGYPIFMEKDGQTKIDFCPKNFKHITSFPKESLLSIEQLNETLIAVNQHFIECIETDGELPYRISISQGLFMLNETR